MTRREQRKLEAARKAQRKADLILFAIIAVTALCPALPFFFI
ncbi:hypothetical protein [Phyllobacterium endophyticum]|nr:hypothetical protein [Phyllobacterium endophyticum]